MSFQVYEHPTFSNGYFIPPFSERYFGEPFITFLRENPPIIDDEAIPINLLDLFPNISMGKCSFEAGVCMLRIIGYIQKELNNTCIPDNTDFIAEAPQTNKKYRYVSEREHIQIHIVERVISVYPNINYLSLMATILKFANKQLVDSLVFHPKTNPLAVNIILDNIQNIQQTLTTDKCLDRFFYCYRISMKVGNATTQELLLNTIIFRLLLVREVTTKYLPIDLYYYTCRLL